MYMYISDCQLKVVSLPVSESVVKWVTVFNDTVCIRRAVCATNIEVLLYSLQISHMLLNSLFYRWCQQCSFVNVHRYHIFEQNSLKNILQIFPHFITYFLKEN